MLLAELSDRFEVLFEDLSTSGSKGLDSYEQSICFTYAQKQLIKALAEAKNFYPISSLIKYNKETIVPTNETYSVYQTAKVFRITRNYFHIIGHFLKGNTTDNGVISEGKDIPLIEVSESVINSMLASSYKYPPKNLAYVMMGEGTVTVFPPFSFGASEMYTRYVEFPTPIILEAITGGDTIDGKIEATEPILDQSFHEELVNAAVQYAIQAYIGQEEKDLGPDDSKRNQ